MCSWAEFLITSCYVSVKNVFHFPWASKLSNTVFRLIKYCKDIYETTFKCIFFTYFSHSAHTLQLIHQQANTAQRQIKLQWGTYTAPTPPLEISCGKHEWHLKQWTTNSERRWEDNVDARNHLRRKKYQYNLKN